MRKIRAGRRKKKVRTAYGSDCGFYEVLAVAQIEVRVPRVNLEAWKEKVKLMNSGCSGWWGSLLVCRRTSWWPLQDWRCPVSSWRHSAALRPAVETVLSSKVVATPGGKWFEWIQTVGGAVDFFLTNGSSSEEPLSSPAKQRYEISNKLSPIDVCLEWAKDAYLSMQSCFSSFLWNFPSCQTSARISSGK